MRAFSLFTKLRQFCFAVGVLTPLFAVASTPVATYDFADGTLSAREAGVPDLVVVDPTGKSGIVSDQVFGKTKRVFRFTGKASPVKEQGGLELPTGNLLKGDAYSVDIVFSFDANGPSWERILDVSNRQNDRGFYVEPGGKLQVYPVGNGPHFWTFGDYHRVTLTNDGKGHVTAYLDGAFQFDLKTDVMNFSTYGAANPKRLLTFFLDNVAGGGQGEYMSGKVALIRVYDLELDAKAVGGLGQVGAPAPVAKIEPPKPEVKALPPWKGGRWKAYDRGGCDGNEVAFTKMQVPDDDLCTQDRVGTAVVCSLKFDGCSYKRLSVKECQGGKVQDRMYVCAPK